MASVRVQRYTGNAIERHLDAVARLRMRVFRDWPYLYDGDMAYERDYLAAYARSPGSLFVLAMDGDEVVGASTGIPLADDAPAFRAPFEARGIGADMVFYCGESILLPAYRGQGIGHAFFDQREAHARALGGFRWTAFCAVDRARDDPRWPPAYRGNDPFWRKRGYEQQPDMRMRLHWKEVAVSAVDTAAGGPKGENDEVAHTLTFWLRPLQGDAA